MKEKIMLASLIATVIVSVMLVKPVRSQQSILAGVNYLSDNYKYSMRDSVLHRDFALFQENDITLIAVNPKWPYIEPSKGSYSDSYLARIKNIIQIANQYGIQVALWFMTNCRSTGGTIPSWVSPRRYTTVLTDASTGEAWVNMLGHVAYYLRDVQVHSWIPLDEPYFYSGSINLDKTTGKNLCYNVWSDAKTAIRQYSNGLFGGARFGCTNNGESAFTNQFDREERFYTLLDIISINYYADWGGGGGSESKCRTEFAAIRAKGKDIYIGGMGDRASSESTQAQNIKQALDFFVECDVTGALAWFWSSTGHLSERWNLCRDSSGTPQQAFYTLASYNEPNGPPPVYACPYCGVEFSTQEELDEHILSEHPEQPRDPPTSIFDDDFESGDFSEWTGITTSSGESVAVVNTLPYQGTYHGRFTSDDDGEADHASCCKTTDEEEVWASGHFYIASGLPLDNDDDRFYLIHFTSGRNYLAGVGIRRHEGSDNWVLYGRNGSGWVGPLYAISPAIEMNRWYCVELHWKKHATNGIVETYVDGERILVMENIDTARFGNISEISFGLTLVLEVKKKLDVYGDCFVVSDMYVGPYYLGDVNRDRSVDVLDISLVAWSYGSVPGDQRWNPNADLNKDYTVGILDITIVAMNYGS